MLHDFLLICYHLAPFLVPFFTLAGILTWISDRLVERTMDREETSDGETTDKEQNQTRRPAC